MLDAQDDYCEEPMPDYIVWLNANVVGCKSCNYKNAYFDCGHELEHKCEEWTNA